MKLQLGWILVFIPRPFCPARITVKPTGGEGERQAGATPIFPKKTEEPKFFLFTLPAYLAKKKTDRSSHFFRQSGSGTGTMPGGTGDRRPAHWPRTCGCGFPRAASPGSPHFAFLSFRPLSASSSSMMAPAMSADSAPPAAAIFCLRRSISSLTVPSGYRSRRSPSAFSQPSSS